MLLTKVFGNNLFVFSLAFSLLGIAAMIALYEFCLVFLDKRTGEIALTLLAFSPLAIAQSRMIFHITPIPFVLVLVLAACRALWQKKKHAAFWASVSLSFLFQFELSLLPLFLLIPYIVWRTHHKISLSLLKEIILGGVLGLTPQILYDLTHHFEQLGGFATWLSYQILMFFVPSKGGLGFHNLQTFLGRYWLYWGRIWGVDSQVISILFFTLIVLSVTANILRIRQKVDSAKMRITMEIILSAFFFLTLGYFVNGTPSEAYFPPYVILLPLILAFGTRSLKKPIQVLVLPIFILIGAFNIWKIFDHNFFVSTPYAFGYGPSAYEQKKVVEFALQEGGQNIILLTQNPNGTFPSFFAGYRYFLLSQGVSENENGQQFFVEKKNSFTRFHNRNFKKVRKRDFESVSVFYQQDILSQK